MYIEPDAPEQSTEDPEAVGTGAPAGDAFAAVPEILRGALQRRGFAQLTDVQQAVLANDDGACDLRISSRTGSGKTVGLGFALAARVADPARLGPTTLILAPVRELAVQVREELAWLFADVPACRCEVVTGGSNIERERRALHRRPEVLVATPGRLLDHLRSGALDLSSVCQLVLDEADQMLDLGFKDELDGILDALPTERRTHLVSATFPREVVELADRFQRAARLVLGQAPGTAHGDIEHLAIKIPPRAHYSVLVNLLLLAGDERTLVFVRTREDTVGLADKLAADGFSALPISGDLAQAQRTRTLLAFKRGTIRALIATDVAARGLDIPDVTTVVHVDPPIDAATYVHRSGRTGRAGQKGRSLLLAQKSQERRLQRLYQQAKVEAVWTFPPGPQRIAARQLERAEERAAAAIADHAIGDAPRAVAAHLLRDRDPVEVIAALLVQAGQGPRAPFPFEEADAAPARTMPAAAAAAAPSARATRAARSAARAPSAREGLVHEHSGGEHAARERSHEPAAPEAPAAPAAPVAAAERRSLPGRAHPGVPPVWHKKKAAKGEPGFTRFRINWGIATGADARRILAHVCRRGGIDSSMVGGIELQTRASVFDVRDEVAIGFAARVRRPDRRDPHLRIAMWRDRSARDPGEIDPENGGATAE